MGLKEKRGFKITTTTISGGFTLSLVLDVNGFIGDVNNIESI
jgi:hypothetical protein